MLSLPAIASAVVAVSLLAFLATRFDVDLNETLDHIKDANPWWYGLAFVTYYMSFIVRGYRWRLLAANVGVHKQPGSRLPSIGESSLLLLLGWFANAIGWLRMGDAYRAYAFSDSARSSMAQSLGIIVAERMIDAVAIFVLLLTASIWLILKHDVGPSELFVVISLAMAVLGVGALIIMARYGRQLSQWLPIKWQTHYNNFHQGTLGGFRNVPMLGILSIGGWFLEVGRLFFVIKALGFDVSLPLVLFAALVNAVLSTVPITPGGLGVVEPGVIGLLSITLAQSAAISIVLLDRSLSYLSIVIVGGIAFFLRQALRRSNRPKPASTTKA
jgi:uncharacterized protein (TIRG00374 family)